MESKYEGKVLVGELKIRVTLFENEISVLCAKKVKVAKNLLDSLKETLQENTDKEFVSLLFISKIYKYDGTYLTDTHLKSNLDYEEFKLMELQLKKFFKGLRRMENE